MKVMHMKAQTKLNSFFHWINTFNLFFSIQKSNVFVTLTGECLLLFMVNNGELIYFLLSYIKKILDGTITNNVNNE